MVDSQVDVVSPEGDVGSVPQSQLNEAMNNGYRQASMQELAAFDKEQKYGTIPEQLKTAAEGAAEAATFGTSTGLEVAAGVNPEAIRARREVNPIPHGAGQMVGLIGSTVLAPELGPARLMEGAGAGGARLLGLTGETALSKIGSSVVKNAIETGIMTGGDEVSKMLSSDPDQSVETAFANVGLGSALGGVFGAGIGSVSPIWEATAGPKVKSFLEAIKNKSGGMDGLTNETESALTALNKNPSPAVRGMLNPELFPKETAQELLEGDSVFGRKGREELTKFRGELSDDLSNAFGKPISKIDENPSEYVTGKEIGNLIADNFEKRIKPLAEEYEAVAAAHSGVPLEKDVTLLKNPMALPEESLGAQQGSTKLPGTISKLQDKLGKLASDESWGNIDEINNLVKKTMTDIANKKTAEDLYKLAQSTGENTFNKMGSPLSRAGQMIKNVIKDEADDLVRKNIAETAPQLLQRYDAAREGWKVQSKLKDDINAILNIKSSTSGFPKNIRAAATDNAEMFIRRLGKGNDAYLINTLKTEMPEVFDKIMDFKKNEILANALETRQAGESVLSLKKVQKGIEKLSPEMQQSMFSPEDLTKLKAIDTLDRAVAERIGPSGTARTNEGLQKWMPSAAMGMLSMFTGHNPIVTTLVTILGGGVSREARDAVKYGLLKYMGSAQEISASGFKGMVGYFENVIRAENKITNGIKNIFKAGEVVIPEKLKPDIKDRERLQKRLDALKNKPEDLLDVGGKSVLYMQDHAGAMGSVSARSLNYLDSIRPQAVKQNPLDSEPVIDKIQKEKYNNALDIADNPLMLLQKVKDGTINHDDINHLNNMLPSLYTKLRSKISDQMIDAVSKETEIPYKTKLGLSIFLGQPLDSTMTPVAIQNNQMAFMPMQAPQGPAPQKKSKTSFNKLSKLETMNMTPQQSAEARKLKG